MWPYLYFYKWIRCYFLWVAMFLCYCLVAIVNTLKSLLGKINHWHRNMHCFFKDACNPTTVDILRVKSLKKCTATAGRPLWYPWRTMQSTKPSIINHCQARVIKNTAPSSSTIQHFGWVHHVALFGQMHPELSPLNSQIIFGQMHLEHFTSEKNKLHKLIQPFCVNYSVVTLVHGSCLLREPHFS